MGSSKGFSTNPFTGMRRPSSSNKSAKSNKKSNDNPRIEQEEDGSTFLTGVQNQGKLSKLDKRIHDDLGIEINQEFDKNRNYELERINAYEEALNQTPRKNRKKYDEDNLSQKSSGSKKSPGKVDFIKENANKIGTDHAKNYTDRLTEHEKSRLQILEDEIEQSFLGDEETAKKILAISDKPEKEKLELMSALVPASEAGETGVTTGMKNAFVYEDGGRMEEINDQLKTKFLALPPADGTDSMNNDFSTVSNMQTSVFGEKQGSEDNVDLFSERSAQLTQISKRSGISGISHSIVSKLSKPVSLPKEKFLREKAESKVSKQFIKEIDDNLDKIRNNNQAITEDQMSRLVDE